ncbi:hypothetical protein QTO30_14525 [Yoonia sp. GPGPB17]|uniref:hypothetical protein n=1 Tax=Yoonia sp. GPGPB17 TaxID=3026147 RepID=UPI0030BE3402
MNFPEVNRDSEEETQDLSALMVGMAALANADYDKLDDRRRIDLYRAFALYYFSQEVDLENSQTPSFLVRYISELLDPWRPLTPAELSCFVQFDIPTFSVDQIINSQKYTNCLGEG